MTVDRMATLFLMWQVLEKEARDEQGPLQPRVSGDLDAPIRRD